MLPGLLECGGVHCIDIVHRLCLLDFDAECSILGNCDVQIARETDTKAASVVSVSDDGRFQDIIAYNL